MPYQWYFTWVASLIDTATPLTYIILYFDQLISSTASITSVSWAICIKLEVWKLCPPISWDDTFTRNYLLRSQQMRLVYFSNRIFWRMEVFNCTIDVITELPWLYQTKGFSTAHEERRSCATTTTKKILRVFCFVFIFGGERHIIFRFLKDYVWLKTTHFVGLRRFWWNFRAYA